MYQASSQGWFVNLGFTRFVWKVKYWGAQYLKML